LTTQARAAQVAGDIKEFTRIKNELSALPPETPVDYKAKANELFSGIQPSFPTDEEIAEDKEQRKNESIMQFGLSLAAAKRPDFLGAVGEAGLAAMPGISDARKAQIAAKEANRKEARELEVTKISTAQGLEALDVQKGLKERELGQKDTELENDLIKAGLTLEAAMANSNNPTDTDKQIRRLVDEMLSNGDERPMAQIVGDAVRKYYEMQSSVIGAGMRVRQDELELTSKETEEAKQRVADRLNNFASPESRVMKSLGTDEERANYQAYLTQQELAKPRAGGTNPGAVDTTGFSGKETTKKP